MVRVISQRALRADIAKVIDAVADGGSFTVIRNGVPVAQIRPIQRRRRTVVPKHDLVALSAGGPHVDAARFRSELDMLLDCPLS